MRRICNGRSVRVRLGSGLRLGLDLKPCLVLCSNHVDINKPRIVLSPFCLRLTAPSASLESARDAQGEGFHGGGGSGVAQVRGDRAWHCADRHQRARLRQAQEQRAVRAGSVVHGTLAARHSTEDARSASTRPAPARNAVQTWRSKGLQGGCSLALRKVTRKRKRVGKARAR